MALHFITPEGAPDPISHAQYICEFLRNIDVLGDLKNSAPIAMFNGMTFTANNLPWLWPYYGPICTVLKDEFLITPDNVEVYGKYPRTLQIDIEQFDRSKIFHPFATIGFLHGHFRFLTPTHMMLMLYAKMECESLILGIESGARTQQYKTKQPPLMNDAQRLAMIENCGIPDFVGLVPENTPYTRAGYEQLIQRLRVSEYFYGDEGFSPSNDDRFDMALAALAAPFYLMQFDGPSTTELIAMYMNR